jgi:hypothetical protein
MSRVFREHRRPLNVSFPNLQYLELAPLNLHGCLSLWHAEFERSDWLGYFIASLAGGAPSLGEIDIRVHLSTLEDVHRINWRRVNVLCTGTAHRSLDR